MQREDDQLSRFRWGLVLLIFVVVAFGAFTIGAVAGRAGPFRGPTPVASGHNADGSITESGAIEIAARRVSATGDLRASAHASLDGNVWKVFFFTSS